MFSALSTLVTSLQEEYRKRAGDYAEGVDSGGCWYLQRKMEGGAVKGVGGRGNSSGASDGKQDDDDDNKKKHREQDKQDQEELLQRKSLALNVPFSVASNMYEKGLLDDSDDVFKFILLTFGDDMAEEIKKRKKIFAEVGPMWHPFGSFGIPGWNFGSWNHQFHHHHHHYPCSWILPPEEHDQLLRQQEQRLKNFMNEELSGPFSLLREIRKGWEAEQHLREKAFQDRFPEFFEGAPERKGKNEKKGKAGLGETQGPETELENQLQNCYRHFFGGAPGRDYGENEREILREMRGLESELDLYEYIPGRSASDFSVPFPSIGGDIKSQKESETTFTEFSSQFQTRSRSTRKEKYLVANSTTSTVITLPDGSSHTKVVTERRYRDGTVEREAKEFETPASPPSLFPITPLPAKQETSRIVPTDDKEDCNGWSDDFEDEDDDGDDDNILESLLAQNYRNYAANKLKKEKAKAEKGEETNRLSFKDFEKELTKAWGEAVRKYGSGHERMEEQLGKEEGRKTERPRDNEWSWFWRK